MEIILLLIRLILVAIFALAGIGKLLDRDGSEKAIKDFGVPDILAKPFSVLLPFAEILIAILLLFIQTSWLGAIGGFLLLLTFSGGMLFQMAKGNAPDCHCFGQIHSERVSAKSLIRNGIFGIMAFFLILSGKDNQGLSVFASSNNSEGNFMSFIIGLATVGLLAAVVFYLKKISEQQTQIIRRMEILELTALGGGREIERENLAHPDDGLPIGAPAPDFVLPDTNGRDVSLKNLLMQAKPILFFFISPTCNPCAALLPEIERWQAELKGKLNFVFVSNGKVKENLDKLAGDGFKQILLQKDKEVALLFGAEWTPTAVLINTDGTVASRTAVGDKAIRELLEMVKTQIDDPDVLLIANGGETNSLGKFLPEFSQTDVFERNITSEDLRGKKTLVTFWSTTCGYCTEMLDDLREWDKSKGVDEPNLLLLSEGDAEPHRDLNLQSPIILDKDRKISDELGMSGTPSAVLINENGKIVSETAIGADNIWSLIGKRK
ncbi:MAG: TlpA family protein disulfide reductase [Acidobacteriota bacterium]|nr:TlpA family protein disulfide reductase [Acidobacteriota bacterium]